MTAFPGLEAKRQTGLQGWVDIAIGAAAVVWLLGYRWWRFAAVGAGIAFVSMWITPFLWYKLWPDKLAKYRGGRIWG